jgi:hypothetical protein
LRSKNNIKPHQEIDILIENFKDTKISKYEDILKKIVVI